MSKFPKKDNQFASDPNATNQNGQYLHLIFCLQLVDLFSLQQRFGNTNKYKADHIRSNREQRCSNSSEEKNRLKKPK